MNKLMFELGYVPFSPLLEDGRLHIQIVAQDHGSPYHHSS